MNLRIVRHLIVPLALAGVLIGHAEEKKEVTVTTTVPAPEKHERRVKVVVNHGDKSGPMETVTFLGVETAPADPTLAAQLGLTEGTGLVVRRVLDDTPAAGALKEHDILTKFADQILIDQRQLSVLIRGKKAGDEVALTVFRGGKEMQVKVKLATHEVPKMAGIGDMGNGSQFRFFHGGMPGINGLENLQDLPGMKREDVDHIVRMLGKNHFNMMVKPQVRVITRGSKGDNSTILNFNQGNIVLSDDDGSIEVNAADGKREITVKNPKGEVTFKGPITSEEDRKKLPAEVTARLDKIQHINVETETGEDFDQEGAAVGEAHKTHTVRKVIHAAPSHAPSF